MIVFHEGEFVCLRGAGMTVLAQVVRANADGTKLVLAPGARIDGHIDMMPVDWRNNGFVARNTGTPMTLEHWVPGTELTFFYRSKSALVPWLVGEGYVNPPAAHWRGRWPDQHSEENRALLAARPQSRAVTRW